MNHTALIVIDIQVALFSNEKYKIYNADAILSNIKHLVQSARAAQVPVIFIQHTSGPEDIFVEGSEGWQIHPFVQPQPSDLYVIKRTPDSFAFTTLLDELQKRDIKKLVICGLQTEYCVDTTCRRAFSLGYENILVKDAHSTFDLVPFSAAQIIEHHHRIMADWFATVIPTKDIQF